jgi:hypothetical protein
MKGRISAPQVVPIQQPEYRSKQSRYPNLPEAGITNGLLVAPSFTGKTTWLSSWILDWMRGAYARIYIFSPNAFTPEWDPVRKYIETQLGIDLDDEPCLFETLDEEKLSEIIATQKKVIAHQKRQKHSTMHAICIILDDLASEPKFHRNYGPISELYTRGRHFFIQTICSSQKWKLLSPTARVNTHWIVCFALRNFADLHGLLSELTAIYPYDVLLAMYEEAVHDRPYSFLFINLKAPKEKMFSVRFEEILQPQGKEDDDDGSALVPAIGQVAGGLPPVN